MADTTFVDGSTLTAADWFNDVNRLHYTIFGDPANADAARTNFGTTMPAFLAYNSATDTDQTGNAGVATVDFDTEVFDRGSDFATDTFTAPVTGIYMLSANVLLTDLSTAATVGEVRIVTSNRTYICEIGLNPKAGGLEYGGHITVLADMDIADTATVAVRVQGMAGDTADIIGSTTMYTYFSGFLVG